MRFYFLFITVFSILFLSCTHNEKTSVEDKHTEKVIIKKKAPVKVKEKLQEEEILSRKNTVAFLEKYGKENPETIVLFRTRLGDIKVRLYRDTPVHRASFIFLAKQGYFNTVCVHRIVKDFVVQGGNSENPLTRRMRKKFDSYTIPSEFKKERRHKYGALAAARDWTNNPNKRSTPFEFYFVQDKNGAFHLDGEHTVYGEIISGFSTLNKIAQEEIDKQEWPKNDVFFEVEVLQ